MTETPIQTVSGCHPYRPQCVIHQERTGYSDWLRSEGHNPAEPKFTQLVEQTALDTAERITLAIGEDRCPRCSDPLYPQPQPDDWRPAGSRALPCRCVPICDTCASYVEPFTVLPVNFWPTDQLDRGEIATVLDEYDTQYEAERAWVTRVKQMERAAVLQVGPEGAVLVDNTGATPFQPLLRPDPGGWLEFGFDDQADEQERTA